MNHDDVLIEDARWLTDRDRTQHELSPRFNALRENHKRIALTADRRPHGISDLAAGLSASRAAPGQRRGSRS